MKLLALLPAVLICPSMCWGQAFWRPVENWNLGPTTNIAPINIGEGGTTIATVWDTQTQVTRVGIYRRSSGWQFLNAVPRGGTVTRNHIYWGEFTNPYQFSVRRMSRTSGSIDTIHTMNASDSDNPVLVEANDDGGFLTQWGYSYIRPTYVTGIRTADPSRSLEDNGTMEQSREPPIARA